MNLLYGQEEFLLTQSTYSVHKLSLPSSTVTILRSQTRISPLWPHKNCPGEFFLSFSSISLPRGPWLLSVSRVLDRRFCGAGLPGVCPRGAGAGLSGCFVLQCTELRFSFFSLLISFYSKTLSISVCINALASLNCPFKENPVI